LVDESDIAVVVDVVAFVVATTGFTVVLDFVEVFLPELGLEGLGIKLITLLPVSLSVDEIDFPSNSFLVFGNFNFLRTLTSEPNSILASSTGFFSLPTSEDLSFIILEISLVAAEC